MDVDRRTAGQRLSSAKVPIIAIAISFLFCFSFQIWANQIVVIIIVWPRNANQLAPHHSDNNQQPVSLTASKYSQSVH